MAPRDPIGVVRRHPLACYFGAAYLVSLAALAIVGLPKLHRGGGRPTTALVMFPVMVIAVGLTGVGLTAVTGGRAGLTQLRSRVAWPAHRRWLLLLALPPMAILVVLGVLDALVSPRFAPKLFVFGIAAGLLAGFSEELGWTGFAYPRLRARFGALPGALLWERCGACGTSRSSIRWAQPVPTAATFRRSSLPS